jgi:hypothetical protein
MFVHPMLVVVEACIEQRNGYFVRTSCNWLYNLNLAIRIDRSSMPVEHGAHEEEGEEEKKEEKILVSNNGSISTSPVISRYNFR